MTENRRVWIAVDPGRGAAIDGRVTLQRRGPKPESSAWYDACLHLIRMRASYEWARIFSALASVLY
jgi:hypothetical protein